MLSPEQRVKYLVQIERDHPPLPKVKAFRVGKTTIRIRK